MPVTEISMTIDAPVDAVWDALAVRFGDLHLWAKGMSDCQLAAPGPVGVGTTRIVTVPNMGALDETVVVFEPTRHLAYAVTGLPPIMKDVRSDWYLEPEGEGTSVRLVSSSKPGLGPLGAVALRVLQGFTAKQLHGLVRGLKKHVERGAA